MRMLGLDIGDRRIGVAITDKLETIASPLTVLANDEKLKENLNKIIKDYNIEKVIIGIPYNLKGEYGFQAEKIKSLVDEIIKEICIEIEYIDERFTSKISSGILKAEGKKVKKSVGNIDKISAAVILNDYLTVKRNLRQND
ncbi:MAG: Holliday junction resolvase RuvX [Actinobacteria bacterium]|nr:Holliday junction resolvase RuvX [Actinomycetota bacterium]